MINLEDCVNFFALVCLVKGTIDVVVVVVHQEQACKKYLLLETCYSSRF